jgi:hypothetical protein
MNMKLGSLLRTPLLILAICLLAGCSKDDTAVDPNGNTSSNSGNGKNTIKLSVTPATSTIFVTDTVKLTAAVSGTTNKEITWTLSPSLGTIDNSGNYVAPQSIVGELVAVTATATAVADARVMASARITVKGPGFTVRRPGNGSNYAYNLVALDLAGQPVGSEWTNTVEVAFANGTYAGVNEVWAFRQAFDTTFVRYDPKGDILKAYPTDTPGVCAWLRMPFGTRQSVDQLVIDRQYDDGSRYTYHYQAEFVGADSLLIGGNRIPVYTVRTTTFGDLAGTNPHVTETAITYVYAPGIGWFDKITNRVTKTDSSTAVKVNWTAATLANYSLR